MRHATRRTQGPRDLFSLPAPAMLGRLLRSRRHRRAALVERLLARCCLLTVRDFADPAVRAALEQRITWASKRKEGRRETYDWVRHDILPAALLAAIDDASREQPIRVDWPTWEVLRPRQSVPPWRYAREVTFVRGDFVRLVVRPRWVGMPLLAWWLRATAIRFAGKRILEQVREAQAPRLITGALKEVGAVVDPAPDELSRACQLHEQDPETVLEFLEGSPLVAEAVGDLATALTEAAVWALVEALPPGQQPLYRAWLEEWPAARIEWAFEWSPDQHRQRRSRLQKKLRAQLG